MAAGAEVMKKPCSGIFWDGRKRSHMSLEFTEAQSFPSPDIRKNQQLQAVARPRQCDTSVDHVDMCGSPSAQTGISGPRDNPCLAVRSMLTIHQGALGDFILALPALTLLRGSFPESRLVLLGYPAILELVRGQFRAEEILSIDRGGMAFFLSLVGTSRPRSLRGDSAALI